jgi:nicotinate-nucleotide pyrophosphorylase (carboxylating)
MDYVDRLIELALEEDLGPSGDITTQALQLSGRRGKAELWAKEPMVLAGLDVFARTFHHVDREVGVQLQASTGDELMHPARVAEVSGPLESILRGERTALNFVQRSCGIATLTRKAVRALGPGTKLLDTRKTSPGMRMVAKAAVRAGGGHNHRFGLFDGILIKDNHIAAVDGSVAEAVRRARANAPMLVKVEVEVTAIEQIEKAIAAGADVLLLDNMSDAQIREAVKRGAGRVQFEVSGGVTLERLPALGQLGVDFVSMGALTHSAPAADLSLELLLTP